MTVVISNFKYICSYSNNRPNNIDLPKKATVL